MNRLAYDYFHVTRAWSRMELWTEESLVTWILNLPKEPALDDVAAVSFASLKVISYIGTFSTYTDDFVNQDSYLLIRSRTVNAFIICTNKITEHPHTLGRRPPSRINRSEVEEDEGKTVA